MRKLIGQMLNGSRNHFFGQPLLLGDEKQIEWVKTATKEFIEKLKDGVRLEAKFPEPVEPWDLDEDEEGTVKYKWSVSFDTYCFLPNCGHYFHEWDRVTISDNDDEEAAIEEYEWNLPNEKQFTCPRCKSVYQVENGYFKMIFPKMRSYEYFLEQAEIEA
jgi:uncharacterized protein YbaR (Trm112 family)